MDLEKFREKQIKYWTDRNQAMFLTGEKDALSVAKLLKSNYEESLKLIQNELYKFYGMYAHDGKLSYEDARKLLDKSELKSFKQELKEMINYAKQNDIDTSKLKQLYTKARVTRLEELKTQIEDELNRLTVENESQIKGLLEDTYTEGYYKSIYNLEKDVGYKINFSKLNTKLVEKATKMNFAGVNYSSALWTNKDNLMTILNQSIPQGLALGYNPKKLAEITSKKLQTNYNNTVRLIRTEYNFIMNQATKDSYKACGIGQYQILATLDDRTSEICQEMDLQIFNYNELEVGVNYPPFHPNCRSTTIPYFEPDEID
jgi:SPP1 gp7 family putative phage head morphogenesis protein